MTDEGYYVCAARLSGKSIEELVGVEIKHAADLDGIRSLFSEAGLGASVLPCGSVAGVRAAVMSVASGANAFGVAFVRLDGSGHMVVAHRGTGGVAFRDYLFDDIGEDATADLNTGTSFWIVY